MTRYVLYTNARILDPATDLDITGQLLTDGDHIATVGENIDVPSDNITVVDCERYCLSPGLIDMRVFIGIPGADYKDTIQNTGISAAAGGVTTVCVQPDTNPIIDDLADIEYLSRRAEEALVNFIPFPAATKKLEGQEMTEIGLMSRAGYKAFTDSNHSIASASLMTRILKYASAFDALIIQHLAEPDLHSDGGMNAGELATRLGLPGIPTAAEVIMLERDLRLLRSVDTRYHASQITCRESIEVMKAAKERGQKVTCGVAVPHLSLNELAIEDYRTFLKLSPPLRHEDDRVAVIGALKDGTIDVIVSGHDPQDPEVKRVPYEQAETGAVGLETMLPVCLELVHNGHMSLNELLAKMTINPARILGLESGILKEGAPADLCLFNPDKPTRINGEKLLSITKNTPFDGRPIQGQIVKTIVGGDIVYEC